MRFNAAKCNIMRVSRMRLPFLYSYKLSGQVLDEVKNSKYLGVTISDNLDWSKHITTTTTKANARLSFIKRNLKDCPQKLKEIAYFSLVRSFVDYASAVWILKDTSVCSVNLLNWPGHHEVYTISFHVFLHPDYYHH